MKFISSLDATDRKLLLWCVGFALALAVATSFLLPNGNDSDNPLPSTYLAGQHGRSPLMRRCCAPIIRLNVGSGL
jgi:hypothetical protein